MATGSSESTKCFKKLPYTSIQVECCDSMAYRVGNICALNVVYGASALEIGESFSIKIIQIDEELASQVDTCLTFGVTSCPLESIEEQHELHLTNLCSQACGGITNKILLRKAHFKQVDSIITFTRRANDDGDSKKFIEISVDGKFVKFMRDNSENQVLSLLPSLVPFVVLNGVVTAILYHQNPHESILDSPNNFVFSNSDNESDDNDVIAISVVADLLREESSTSINRQGASQSIHNNGKVDVAVGTDSMTSIDRSCVICLSAPRTHLLLPCYHFAFCESHAQDRINQTCPMCRKPVTGIHKCYDS